MPVASLSAVTVAPGTTAPAVSVTVPATREVLVCADAAEAAQSRRAKMQSEVRRVCSIVGLLLRPRRGSGPRVRGRGRGFQTDSGGRRASVPAAEVTKADPV